MVPPNRTMKTPRLLLALLPFAITSCGEEKVNNPDVLKEVIDVQGMCAEDHVGQQDNYAGQIVRWQSVKTGEVLTYGFIAKGDLAQHVLDEVTAPTVYHTPFMISFMKIDIDTTQPKWVLHGVSNRGEPEGPIRGYDTTCNLEVVNRGMDIRILGAPQNTPLTPPTVR
jgi:hypothetical protein